MIERRNNSKLDIFYKKEINRIFLNYFESNLSYFVVAVVKKEEVEEEEGGGEEKKQ